MRSFYKRAITNTIAFALVFAFAHSLPILAMAAEDNMVAVPTEAEIRKIIEAADHGDAVFDFSESGDIKEVQIEFHPDWFENVQRLVIVMPEDVTLQIPQEIFAWLYLAMQDVFYDESDRLTGLTDSKIILTLNTKSPVRISFTQDERELDVYSYQYPMLLGVPVPYNQWNEPIMYEHTLKARIPRCWQTGNVLYANIYKPGAYSIISVPDDYYGDLQGFSWAEEAICYLNARDIVQGTGTESMLVPKPVPTIDGYNGPTEYETWTYLLFSPGDNVTRADFMTMLMRALDVQVALPTNSVPFADWSDMPDYAQSYALEALWLDIISGDENRNFNPYSSITRQDMITMVYRAMDVCNMLNTDWPDVYIDPHSVFSDWDDIDDYAETPVFSLAYLNIINGSNGKVYPTSNATRAEAAQLIFNLLRYDAQLAMK